MSLVFCSTAVITACVPPATSGNCLEDADCPGRGQFCEDVTNVCMEGEADYTATDDDSPSATFSDKAIYFFRGKVCTAPDRKVAAGAAVPLSFQPCLHPCMTAGIKTFQHQWHCNSGICDGMTLWYTVGAGNNCPAEAWGQFPKDQCQYLVEADAEDVGLSTSMGPVSIDGSPVQGTLRIEFPFLTNTDVSRIVAYKALTPDQQGGEASMACNEDCAGKAGEEKSTCLESCLIEELAFQYLQQPDRLLEIDLRSGNPTPPESCRENNPACECFEIGFG